MRGALVCLSLVACMDQDDVESDFAVEYCTLLEECEALATYGYRNTGECEDHATVITDSCDFSEDKGETCLDDIAQTGCMDLLEAAVPVSCLSVCG